MSTDSPGTIGRDPLTRAAVRHKRGQRAMVFVRVCMAAALVAAVVWWERPVSAATTANVLVNAGTTLATMPATAFGLNSAVWDANLLDSGVPGLLLQAGVTMVRFPGGSTSDGYHWQTNSITPGQGGYANPNNTFDAFMGQVQRAGAQAMVTVNYGSNAAGTGGGDPAEAASWVTYANVTKHYGVRYWEIGNEIYGNGTYGSAWETDLHSTKGPAAYANNALGFITAMKSADPTIKVGVVLTAPGNWPDGVSPDWNSTVLSIVGTKLDFAIVHWYPQGPGSESDAGLLGATGSVASMMSTLHRLIAQYCGANAPNVQIMTTETNSVSYNPGKQTVSLVNALFLADDYMAWLENGAANVDWWDLHNGISTGNNNSGSLYGTAQYGDYGMVADATSGGGQTEPSAETPFPPYYGLQMLSHLGAPGDQLVAAQSDQALVAAHAVKQANGDLALLLINKDPSNTAAVNVSVSGYSPASGGTQYFYGENSGAITSGAAAGLGGTFSETLPPYSLTTLVMTPNSGAATATTTATGTPAPATATGTPVSATSTATATPQGTPGFSQTTTVSPGSVQVNGSTTIKTTITVTSGSFSDGIVDIEIYDPSWNKVAQQHFDHQSIAAGASAPYSFTWTAPGTTGAYAVAVGTFNGTWSTNYFWVSPAATVNVTSAAPSATPSASATPVPPTGTATDTAVPPTRTNTPVPPTSSATNTPVPPTNTATRTPVPPTATATHTAVPPTRTNTPVAPTSSPTRTPAPATATGTPSATPSFRDITTVSSATPVRGGSETINTTITVASGSLRNGIVDLEVYNTATAAKVGQLYFSGQNLAAGTPVRYRYLWTVPSVAAHYAVMVGVFGSNWSPDYYWDSSAAQFSVR